MLFRCNFSLPLKKQTYLVVITNQIKASKIDKEFGIVN